MSIECYKCHKEIAELSSQVKISKNEECPHCYTSLKCCKMCVFYDPHAYNECKEPVAERIVDKEKANFCDYFQLGTGKSSQDNKEDIMAAAEKLFKF